MVKSVQISNMNPIHAIFSFGYIPIAVCNDDMMEISMYCLWNSHVRDSSVSDTNGYSYQHMLMYNSFYSNDINIL